MLKQAFPSWLFSFLYIILVVGTKTPLSAMVAHCECRINLDHIFSLTGMWYLPHTQKNYNSLTYFCTKNKPVPFFFLFFHINELALFGCHDGPVVKAVHSKKGSLRFESNSCLFFEVLACCPKSKVMHARSFLKWIYDSWDRLHANVTLNWISH